MRLVPLICRSIQTLSSLATLGLLVAGTFACSTPNGDASPSGDVAGGTWFRERPVVEDDAVSGAAWPEGTFALPEIMGSGVALLDYDADGDLDILHVRYPPPGVPGGLTAPAPNRLYEQRADGTFVDVTTRAGVGDPGYGQGVAVGDVDDDGDLDLYFTNLGADAFYVSNGDGTYEDRTAEAGFSGDAWSTAAAFCDVDRDGDLDLFVTHYVEFGDKGACISDLDVPDYCGPQNFRGVPDVLYRNDGGGRFTDVSSDAGLVLPDHGVKARGLGAVCVDLTGDGWPDLYVANDGEPNQLWVNDGSGGFSDEATIRGVAVNRHGRPEASMGIAAGDVDGDGAIDLFMTHLSGENNTLYMKTGDALFTDRSGSQNLAVHDMAFTGFGCGFADFDLDGDLDLVAVNGRVYRGTPRPGASLGTFWNQFGEPNLLFENDGTGRFELIDEKAGPLVSRVEVSRGLAFGDVDNDGDVDLVVSNSDNTLRLLINEAPRDAHWLTLRLLTGRRDAIGAVARIRAGERSWVSAVLPSYSYLSSSDLRVHVGLGGADSVDSVAVAWPDGRRERFEIDGVDREVTLRQGEGIPE